ncbi:hypothetical protein L0128_11805 [candidate division KSB1 bacterium]|nr:hypothetical protein [candidate division KSB1 bacterium]
MKPRFRYSTTGNWYKGNTHIHTQASDGGKTIAELTTLYAQAGYHFLFQTDHWVPSRVESHPPNASLLWLDGVELDGRDYGRSKYHIVCLGKIQNISQEMGLVAALEAARAQGAFLILAHPQWLENTLEDALRYGFHGVEIYNHVCRWLNGKSDGSVYWRAMLKRFPNTLAFAVDDAHIRPEHPGWNGGWIMVNSPACTQTEIMRAIRAGNFYASCGPEFHTIELDGAGVRITTSPIQFARLAGPADLGRRLGNFEGHTFTSAEFEIPTTWDYVYLEIEDRAGQRAWTNLLFCDE